MKHNIFILFVLSILLIISSCHGGSGGNSNSVSQQENENIEVNDLTIIGSVDTPGYAYDVYVSGNYAYVADYERGLQVIDVSTPQNPILVGAADTPDMPFDVFISGKYAYVADNDRGLQIIELDF